MSTTPEPKPEPTPAAKPAPKAKVGEETVEVTKPIEDYRFKIAIRMTYGYIILLGAALVATALGVTGLFEKVAAAISGPIGAVWGYYFGGKGKPEE